MRRQQKGGRGVHARTHHTRPWWETDKSQINPATGGSADLGGGGEGSANATHGATGTTAVAAGGDGGSGGVAPGSGSAPRPQQSPADQRQDGRYSHKERHADQAPADRRRDQIGRTPPPTSSRSVGMRGQAFSPSRVQTSACASLPHTLTRPPTPCLLPTTHSPASRRAQRCARSSSPRCCARPGQGLWHT
jgi:hypothetical protein